MKPYSDTDLNEKIHAFLTEKMSKFPELERATVKHTREPRKVPMIETISRMYESLYTRYHKYYAR